MDVLSDTRVSVVWSRVKSSIDFVHWNFTIWLSKAILQFGICFGPVSDGREDGGEQR